jgi:hypothetical protein
VLTDQAAVFIDIIGRPLTPLSFAGVARRSAFRGAMYAVLPAPLPMGLAALMRVLTIARTRRLLPAATTLPSLLLRAARATWQAPHSNTMN